MRKAINILMAFLLVFIMLLSGLVYNPGRASASGWVVSGSNAVKNAVINSMESVGIKFTGREAKEKAYDAWNMKAYEMWKEDEKNGRNAELWQSFIQETERIERAPIEPLPDKTGFGKMLLEATWFGMAISIGASAGFSIEEAQIQNRAMQYLQNDLIVGEGYSLASNFGLTMKYREIGGNYKSNVDLYGPDGKVVIGGYSSVLYPDPALTIQITGARYVSNSNGNFYIFNLYQTARGTSGRLETYFRESSPIAVNLLDIHQASKDTGAYVVEGIPMPEHVPQIRPNPYVEPLIQPQPDISTVPNIVPHPEPVPVIVPVEPFGDNPYIESYVPPGDNPIPDTDPNDKPGTDTDDDDKPNITPNPNTDTPPYVEPTKPPEETPEYPEETTATEVPSLFGKLWEWLKAILDALFKILNAILALPFVLLEMLWDFLWDLIKAVFVPSEDFWDNNLNELKKVIYYDELEDMVDDFSSIADGGGGSFKDIVVSLMGVDGLTVIDADSINSILDNIHSWVRGVIFPLLILFNINSLYKLIRGTSLVEATKGLAAREKGGK